MVEQQRIACALCSKEIALGEDAWRKARGVVGTRDFIELESRTFCSQECLEADTVELKEFDPDEEMRRLGRRVA